MTPRQYILIVAASGMLWGTLLMGAVVWVNPWSEFPTDSFVPLVPNQYAIKDDLWADGDWETVVVGSSRSQNLLPIALEDHGFGPSFNYAVGGAELTDMAAIANSIRERDAPSTLIVGLDSWQLRVGPSTSLRISNVAALAPYVEDGPTVLDYAQVAAANAITRTHYRDMAKAVALEIRGHGAPGISFDSQGGLPDAAQAYMEGKPLPGDEDYVQALLPGEFLRHATIDRADPNASRHLRTLMEAAPTVHIYLSPMHPDLQAALDGSGHNALIDATLAWLVGHCRASLHVHDLRTVPDWDVTEFRDPTHVKGLTGGAIAAALADPDADLCSTRNG